MKKRNQDKEILVLKLKVIWRNGRYENFFKGIGLFHMQHMVRW